MGNATLHPGMYTAAATKNTGMTKKELERKIAKTLRKANRLKTSRAQIEKVNEVLHLLQGLLPHSLNAGRRIHEEVPSNNGRISPEYLQLYIELCQMHKLKFQIDGLLQGILTELKKIAQYPESMTHDLYHRLANRLGVILAIEPEHHDAQEKLALLTQSYPEFAQQSRPQHALIDITPYQADELTIDLEIPLAEMTEHEQLRALYKPYQTGTRAPQNDETDTICQLRFSLKHIKDFEVFHEELHTRATYQISVNNLPLEEKIFSAWFLCYKKSLKAGTPQYCYGASAFSFNVFGCHKLDMPDVAKEIERCWFHYGELDDDTGLFIVANDQIAEKLRRQLYTCGFCPALSQEKITLGLALLPKYINPECDSRWEYFYQQGKRVGVLPAGRDIAVATTPLSADQYTLPDLIAVSSTPYIDRALQYLVSHDLHDLEDTSYTHLLSCISCGSPYRPQTMICSKCKSELWKLAMRDIEIVIPALRTTRTVALAETSNRQPSPSPAASLPKSEPEVIIVNAPEVQAPPVGIALKKPLPPRKSEPVSFDALWQDPAVQEMLAPTSEAAIPLEQAANAPAATAQAAVSAAPAAPVVIPDNTPIAPVRRERAEVVAPPERPLSKDTEETPRQRPTTPAKLELHEKLRGLMSRKYRERKAIEHAFAEPEDFSLSTETHDVPVEEIPIYTRSVAEQISEHEQSGHREVSEEHLADEETMNAVKQLRPRQKSDLSKRGVVRVIYHATTDIETCPLCAYLDGMVMDPENPATDIFSPPLFPGCSCRRAYVLKTEKPSNWPEVTFRFPPKELLEFLEK